MKKKDKKYYLSLPYEIRIVPEEEGAGFVAMIPDLPGCLSRGDTVDTAVSNLRDAQESWIEAAIEDKISIKEPHGEKYSGQLRLRMPKELHKQLAYISKEEGVSMNQYCVYALQKALLLEKHSC